jgi:phage internal scaffolding protein
MADPIFGTQYHNYERVQHVNEDEDMTKQSFKDEVDINLIVKKYDKTGLVTHLNQAQAQYADVSTMGDYQDALDVIQAAEAAFMEMSAKQRKVFNNSAAEFLDAAHDPEKRDLLVKAGLLEPTPDPATVDAGTTTSEPEAGGAG